MFSAKEDKDEVRHLYLHSRRVLNSTTSELYFFSLLSVPVVPPQEEELETTWYAGSQSQDRDGGDRVLDSGDAAQMLGQVREHSHQRAHEAERAKERGIPMEEALDSLGDLAGYFFSWFVLCCFRQSIILCSSKGCMLLS